ncbi:MAG: glycosyltransferase family 4 protein [Nitrososphaerota archaeon]|jgi:glycosyltransferase involved in cell wall biosynthesis|uniref:glycosyltransferase family 4 protein n=1 Tax=Candidatus Bathycorpusculum sp. TaxID=2994959 RepID=UPI002821492C|nr:glycosyltransferase family 4 protein [Candidatus Termitimicrobium sp.]MCL2432024.1 glycosyltransferase family 4 protein [Candidatus Termitimicrobium sp.]MDR0493463.1 glycosyltransferase family 4 protein [Nitrososphaerota archaeon]
MKIAVFVYEYPPKIVGGLGTYAAEITRKFVLNDHDVTVFTMNDDAGSMPTREIWRGIEIHRPLHIDISDSLPDVISEDIKKWGRGQQLFGKLMVYNYLSAAKLINELIKHEGMKYDVVVAHDWLSAMGGTTVKRESGLPFAFHVHSTEKGRTMGTGSGVVSNIELRTGKMADMVVTVSYAMKDELIGLGFPKEKIQVSYNGVDPQKYNPEHIAKQDVARIRAKYGIKDDEYMLLFIGRLVGVKGVDKLILAMPHILSKLPQAKLVIVGVGDLQEYLTNLTQITKMGDYVKFCFDFIPEEERILHYAACDIAVFPSFYEPFGIVALEAMSMEKPVVVGAAGVSGMREIVICCGPEQCGYHIDPHNPSDIAWGVISTLETDNWAKKLGKNGRKRVLTEFTWNKIAEKTVNLYETIAKR